MLGGWRGRLGENRIMIGVGANQESEKRKR